MKTHNFTPTTRFISILVYKFPLGNCGGVTDTAKSIYIPSEMGNYTFEELESTNQLHLIFTEEQRGVDYWALSPIIQPEGKLGPMSGGNIAYSSDSRCKRIYHIHDRFETQEEYNFLSR